MLLFVILNVMKNPDPPDTRVWLRFALPIFNSLRST